MNQNRLPQQNSIIRALSLLDILKNETDRNHKLTQEQLLSIMKKNDGSCTLKTMRTDLKNLMAVINPIIYDVQAEYNEHPEDFRIIYDGIEEGRRRMSGIQYIQDFSNTELDFLIGLIKDYAGSDKEKAEEIIEKLKHLGSKYYHYCSDVVQVIPNYTTIDRSNLNQNIWKINEAITQNRQLSFTFNGYNRNGKLVPRRNEKYIVNPYYIVSYFQKYYMLCTHGDYEDVHIYRLDLMSGIELSQNVRKSIREVPELAHTNAIEYMKKHPNMYYDSPRTITLKVKSSTKGYTAIHDLFGESFTYKRTIDEQYDEIEVIASADAVLNYAFLYSDLVEIIRPLSLKKKFLEKIKFIQEKYSDNI